MHKVAIDGIISNITSLVQTGNYGDINAADPTTLKYYIVKYVYDNFTLQ